MHRLKWKWLCGARRDICTEDLCCHLFKVKTLTFYLKSTKRTHKVIKEQCSMFWAQREEPDFSRRLRVTRSTGCKRGSFPLEEHSPSSQEEESSDRGHAAKASFPVMCSREGRERRADPVGIISSVPFCATPHPLHAVVGLARGL